MQSACVTFPTRQPSNRKTEYKAKTIFLEMHICKFDIIPVSNAF